MSGVTQAIRQRRQDVGMGSVDAVVLEVVREALSEKMVSEQRPCVRRSERPGEAHCRQKEGGHQSLRPKCAWHSEQQGSHCGRSRVKRGMSEG